MRKINILFATGLIILSSCNRASSARVHRQNFLKGFFRNFSPNKHKTFMDKLNSKQPAWLCGSIKEFKKISQEPEKYRTLMRNEENVKAIFKSNNNSIINEIKKYLSWDSNKIEDKKRAIKDYTAQSMAFLKDKDIRKNNHASLEYERFHNLLNSNGIYPYRKHGVVVVTQGGIPVGYLGEEKRQYSYKRKYDINEKY